MVGRSCPLNVLSVCCIRKASISNIRALWQLHCQLFQISQSLSRYVNYLSYCVNREVCRTPHVNLECDMCMVCHLAIELVEWSRIAAYTLLFTWSRALSLFEKREISFCKNASGLGLLYFTNSLYFLVAWKYLSCCPVIYKAADCPCEGGGGFAPVCVWLTRLS